jgi:hypothetical protein
VAEPGDLSLTVVRPDLEVADGDADDVVDPQADQRFGGEIGVVSASSAG